MSEPRPPLSAAELAAGQVAAIVTAAEHAAAEIAAKADREARELKRDAERDALTSPLGAQVACATGFGASLVAAFPACPNAGTGYPQQNGQVNLIPLPKQKSMPNPCAGVPDNPWCRHGKPRPAARKKKKNHGGAERAA